MKLVPSLSVLVLLCQCASVAPPLPRAAQELCSEDGAVLKVVIEHIDVAKMPSRNGIMVVYGETLGGQLLEVERKLQFDEAALRSVRRRNTSADTLPVCFSEEPVVVIAPSIARKVWQSHSRLDTPPEFAAVFPTASGMYSFHLPGYTADGRQALVHYMWTAGSLAVESVWVSLRKWNGKWSIEWMATDWVS